MKLRDVDGMRCLYGDRGCTVTCVATDGYVAGIGYYEAPPEVGAVVGKFGDRIRKLLGRQESSRDAARGYVRGALGAVASSGVFPPVLSAAMLATARKLPAGDSDVVQVELPETPQDAMALLERALDAADIAYPPGDTAGVGNLEVAVSSGLGAVVGVGLVGYLLTRRKRR